MKRLLYLFVLLSAIAIVSCEKNSPEKVQGSGKVHIELGSNITVKEFDGGFKTIPSVDDFIVIIYNEDGSPAISFNRAAEMPDTLELAVGNYYVEAFSSNNLPAEFENPYYYGEAQLFTVSSNMHLTVEVNCLLSNTIVSVLFSENVINSFLNYSCKVQTDLGFLIFEKSETRRGYFATAPMDITVELEYLKPDGTPVNRLMAGSIPSPEANKHYQISVDASIMDGMASILVLQDTTEAVMEFIEISDGGNDSLPDGQISYGDLLITEIMYDPAALSDTEGEFFEIYNNSDKPINLQNLILGRDDTNMHTITDSIIVSPGDYYIMAKNVLSADVSNKYVYGSAITLSNTGAVLTIYNEEVDGNPGEIIFSVDYGASGFPGGSGASICLNPGKLNPADAILGASWCTSTSAYNTGDLGTPGTANDNCQ